jgi:casein kinase II subunit beta
MSTAGYETDESSLSWIEWHCELPQNRFLCEVDRTFIEDKFNLYGLKAVIKGYEDARLRILDLDDDSELDEQTVTYDERNLYGLIHARYIMSGHGLDRMHRKYKNREFGVCPRIMCEEQPVVPMGMSWDLKQTRACIYCPRCNEVYNTEQCQLDGAYFGPSFPHMFFMTYEPDIPTPYFDQYTPKVYGFRVNHRSRSMPPHIAEKTRSNPSYILQNLSVFLTSTQSEDTMASNAFNTTPFVKPTRENSQRTTFSTYYPPPASSIDSVTELVGNTQNSQRKTTSAPSEEREAVDSQMTPSTDTSESKRYNAFIAGGRTTHEPLTVPCPPSLLTSLSSSSMHIVSASSEATNGSSKSVLLQVQTKDVIKQVLAFLQVFFRYINQQQRALNDPDLSPSVSTSTLSPPPPLPPLLAHLLSLPPSTFGSHTQIQTSLSNFRYLLGKPHLAPYAPYMETPPLEEGEEEEEGEEKEEEKRRRKEEEEGQPKQKRTRRG